MSNFEHIQTKATEALGYFVQGTRDNGIKYWYAKDAPDWVTALCRVAHGSMLPDDYKYEFIHDALFAICEYLNEYDAEENAIEPDCYTGNLLAWLSSHLERVDYVDAAVDEFGKDSFVGIVAMITIGQVAERQEVFSLVYRFLSDYSAVLRVDGHGLCLQVVHPSRVRTVVPSHESN